MGDLEEHQRYRNGLAHQIIQIRKLRFLKKEIKDRLILFLGVEIAEHLERENLKSAKTTAFKILMEAKNTETYKKAEYYKRHIKNNNNKII